MERCSTAVSRMQFTKQRPAPLSGLVGFGAFFFVVLGVAEDRFGQQGADAVAAAGGALGGQPDGADGEQTFWSLKVEGGMASLPHCIERE